jgi:hypothetical protein
LVLAYLLHTADHLHRGLGEESAAIIGTGTLQALLLAGAVALVAVGHRRAPLAALIVGVLNAAGFLLQHLLPGWFGPLSDSYLHAPPSHAVSGFSWFTAVFDIVAALCFAAVGAAALRTPRFARPAANESTEVTQ